MTQISSKFFHWGLIGASSYCAVCNRKNQGFLPLDDYYRQNFEKYGYKHFGKEETLAVDTYSCKSCGASDRERIYAYWINLSLNDGLLTRDSKVIHFAPEPSLSKKLRGVFQSNYETADMMMDGCDYQMDLMSLPFDDESYDFFICSHVLEHVESDDQAISELYRITRKNGCGVLMVPIIVGLKATLEDKAITTEEERWQHFGQNDHLRLYAHDDYAAKIRKHGFSLREYGWRDFGSSIIKKMGLKKSSKLYVVTRQE